tara:strand:- start:1265 stop:1663 length:399 start_codon:yes stop_codon:yes gene_type:complete
MSILDLYKNPPNNGRQIRFKNGEADTTVSSYEAYQKNDQTSLKNSSLHYETPDQAGYSTDGSPNVKLNSNRYFAAGEIPSDLSMNQGKTISTDTFTQPYTPSNGYQYEALSGDLAGLADLQGASDTINSLER